MTIGIYNIFTTMIKEAIIKLIITCFIPCLGYSQDLKTVFLDSIDINHYIAKAFFVDTVIMKSEYSVFFEYF